MTRTRPATRRALLAGAATLFAGSALLVAPVVPTDGPSLAAPAAADTEPAVEVVEDRVRVGPEPGGERVEIDTTTFAPTTAGPHPAVLATHGFGGSKDDLVGLGRQLAADGYVVLTYSARGFGDSGGRIHVADPDFEVADAQALLDVLAERDDVQLDAEGDPRVGAVGASYSGALALMTAALDDRVDTVVAAITWHDLADAFFPQAAAVERPGPFKQLWASRFFLGSALQGVDGADAPDVCGRFAPELCRELLDASSTGRPSPRLLEVLREHSPAAYVDGIGAPTYLLQGMADSLFGTDQADATARALEEQGTEVAVRWSEGGHDALAGSILDEAATVATWLDTHLRGGEAEVPAFAVDVPGRPGPGPDATEVLAAAEYAFERDTVTLDDRPQPLLNPPGGVPASLTTVPGTGNDVVDEFSSEVSTYPLAALPGQSAAFDTLPFQESRTIVGAPQVTLDVTSTGDASTLFLSLWQVTADDTATLPRQLVAPVRLATTPGERTSVDVTLPGGTWRVSPGSRLRVLVTTTDQTYAAPRAARADLVSVSDLRLPAVPGAEPVGGGSGGPDAEVVGLLLALTTLALGALAVLAVRRRRSRHRAAPDPELVDVPLVVRGLVKTYADGHRAVDDVSWSAARGQVVGLLGPNGAGKTTTLRMVMGLIRPDTGSVHVLGEPVRAGSPVLARVGALIEGPGFLPHLTGWDNLRAYWAATGRPEEEARFEEVLEVAALGGAVDRPVRTYSQGMRQRLGIAQAMLGLPEVLVLDEPTNGLDPPQIAGLRPILQDYAATGRTVVVSSHLLAEVEMTCSHVVVMHAGRVVVTGTVEELVDEHRTLEQVFLGVIAQASGSQASGSQASGSRASGAGAGGTDPDLRQVRPR